MSTPVGFTTHRLLRAGLVAGPLFLAVIIGQLLTREGFDIRRQPISLLSLGDQGWIQVSNFVVTGVLCIVFAIGVGRTVTSGPGRTWLSLLFVGFGLGILAGGIFVPDPGMGYPVGAPEGIPEHLSWHGMLHAVAPPLAFVALVAGCIVVARRFRAEGLNGWATYSLLTGVLVLFLSAIGDMASSGVRLLLATAIGFAWVAAFAHHLRRQVRAAARP